ncbi:MAG TPA: membrane protein insertase YidC, partial [Gammaproteobacteria bacterium]|nr:membrane protein insertase YidC [Gammaproteobacteria bacterium]
MDNRRLFLFAALVMVAFLIYQAWMQDYGPKTPAPQPLAANTSSVAPVPEIPTAPNAPTATANTTSSAAAISSPGATKQPTGEQIHVHTDVLDVIIDTAGGDIRQAELPEYPVELKKPQLVKVLN